MKTKKRGIRLIYLIMLLVILITPILICIYNLIKYPASSENIKEENVRDILNLTMEENAYSYQKEDLNENYEVNTIMDDIEPHIDEITKTKYITYEDIGINNKLEDDYEIIKKTHEIANKNGYEVRATLSEYHIYRLDDINPIYIETNTNWNGAKFIIHDENIKDLDTKNYPIFQIVSTKQKEVFINNADVLKNITINKQTKQIKELAGYGNCLCIVYNSNKKQYIRSGSNNNVGNDQLDLFKIDNKGNVLNEIQWDFDEITKIKLIPIPNETLIVENGNFQTNLPEKEYEQETGYYNRNIVCNRSNTILKNINHTANNSELIGGPYFGFIKLSCASDVIFSDSELFTHKYNTKSNYDLILEFNTNITIQNITSNDIEKTDRWGIVGSNYTKDITYENCTLNRIDAHAGVHNLNINNCIIGSKGITVVGSGKLNISNVTSLCNNSFISLREDYGSTWDGEINIKDSTYITGSSSQLIHFKVSYNEDNSVCNYGYDLYLPNINIDNLTIDNKNNKHDFYIFFNDKNHTGKDDGNISDVYKLPKNVVIKNYNTTPEKNIYLFYQKFYNNLDELGINLSVPLADKKEVEIKNNSGENVQDGTITNNNITIKYEETEGIKTIVKVNNEQTNENEKILDCDGTYNIEITYQNSAGEYNTVSKKITIDKTPPTITGVKEGKTYKNEVIPNITDDNLQEVKLLLDGKKVDNYVLNSEVCINGIYQMIATDKAGNVSTINFQIIEPGENDYKIKDGMILNISNNTTKNQFSEKLANDVEFDILREKKVLSSKDIIATGDILKTKSGKKYELVVVGDIDKNGKVTATDLTTMNQHILKEINLEGAQLTAADINGDKKITATDFAAIISIIQKN